MNLFLDKEQIKCSTPWIKQHHVFFACARRRPLLVSHHPPNEAHLVLFGGEKKSQN